MKFAVKISGVLVLFGVFLFTVIDVQGRIDKTRSSKKAILKPNVKVYTVGERGPAGGIVFYDKGNSSDGWRYFEAAPNDQSDALPWGCSDIKIGTTNRKLGGNIGDGKKNAGEISGRCTDYVSACYLCNNLSLGGYTDWFLPSEGELDKMIGELFKQGNLNNFVPWRYYWSSTEDWSFSQVPGATDKNEVFCSEPAIINNQYKPSGGNLPKNRSLRVRCIRAF